MLLPAEPTDTRPMLTLHIRWKLPGESPARCGSTAPRLRSSCARMDDAALSRGLMDLAQPSTVAYLFT